MKDLRSIYIAGPMSGHADWNYPAFFDAEEILKWCGYTPVNPARLNLDAGYTIEKLHQLSSEQFQLFTEGAIKRDLEAVLECDAVVLLPGWEDSKGARAEKAVAEWAGKEIGYLSHQKNKSKITWGESALFTEKAPL